MITMTCPHHPIRVCVDGLCAECWKDRTLELEASNDRQAKGLVQLLERAEKAEADLTTLNSLFDDERTARLKTEAAAAELLTHATQLARDMESIVAWKLPPSYHAFMKRDHQPENDYGLGYLPPDKARVLVEALRHITTIGECNSLEDAVFLSNQALAQLKDTQ